MAVENPIRTIPFIIAILQPHAIAFIAHMQCCNALLTLPQNHTDNLSITIQ
jgi:hypothetical protein